MFDDFVGKTIEEASTNQEWLDYHEGFSKYLEFDSVASLCAKVNTLLNIVFCKELPSDGSWELLLETIVQSELDNMPQSCDLVLMAYCLIRNYRDTLTTEPFVFVDFVDDNESAHLLISGSIACINLVFLFDSDSARYPYLKKDRIEDVDDAMYALTKWWNTSVLSE